jgi:hypothetical protein
MQFTAVDPTSVAHSPQVTNKTDTAQSCPEMSVKTKFHE